MTKSTSYWLQQKDTQLTEYEGYGKYSVGLKLSTTLPKLLNTTFCYNAT